MVVGMVVVAVVGDCRVVIVVGVVTVFVKLAILLLEECCILYKVYS